MEQTTPLSELGRKIFFVNPSFSIRSRILPQLMEHEYEIYTFSGYARIKGYLTVHKNAVLFINPEQQLSISAWIRLIKSIQDDPEFNSTKIGILCDHLPATDELLLMNSHLISAGIFHAEGNAEQLLPGIVQKLESLKAKGRRRFLRTSCVKDANARFLWIQGDRMYQARVIDLSTGSLAILLPSETIPFLNTQSDIFATLQFHTKQVQIQAKSLIVKKKSSCTHAVIFMITGRTPLESIAMIRTYVYEMLAKEMELSVQGQETDKTNYHT